MTATASFFNRLQAQVQKNSVRDFYAEINRHLSSSITFLNYGYAAGESFPTDVSENCQRLVQELLASYQGKPTRILDVGCGRGGTVEYLSRLFPDALVSGLDLSPHAILFCHQRYDQGEFLVGDAEDLPFKDDLFDLVTNVESSHCYPRLKVFFQEVHRVLKPGGSFLYTDIAPAKYIPAREEFLAQLFGTMEGRDITSQVLLSCDQTNPLYQDIFQETPHLLEYLPTNNSVSQKLASGEWTYKMYRLVAQSGRAADS